MNFQVLPPEITSLQIFGGAGSGPMLAAAEGWQGLAAELNAAVTSFESLTTELASGAWQGAASAAMTAAATPYLGWLSAASAHAETAAGLAQAAAAAFEAAQAATVYPAAIAANRTQLVALVNSNLLGLNTPAIFAAEAEYEMMWAQDIAAMVGYHGETSAIAAALTPIVQPLTKLANLPTQAAAAMSATLTGPPPAAVEIPTISLPPFNIPPLGLPTLNLPSLGISNFSLPELNIPQISLGSFSLPPTSISLSMQSLTIPSFTFPAISLPSITIGGFSTPQLATAPFVLPSVQFPASGFYFPSGGDLAFANKNILTNGGTTSLNYVSIMIGPVPKVLFSMPDPIGVSLDLKLPQYIPVNFALRVSMPSNTPGIYIGDFDLVTKQFEPGAAGFVLPPIEITGFTTPSISIPAWQTPEITLTNPGATIDIGPIGVNGVSLGPLIVPPINIGQFEIPNIAIGAIDLAGFTTPPLTVTGGSIGSDFFNLIPKIGVEWPNPLSGLVNPGPEGPTLGPITTPAISVSVDSPQITIPQISFPPFNLNAVTVPPVNLSPFSLGSISVPNIQVNAINVGAIDIPSISIKPQLPNISIGTFTAPAITVGNFNLPAIRIPEITTPEITLFNPHATSTVALGMRIDSVAFVGLGNSLISLNPNPFETSVNIAIPPTQIPPLTLINGRSFDRAFSLVIDNVALGAFTLPQLTINQFNLALPAGPQLNLSDLGIGNISLSSLSLPQITVPPIGIGPLTGTTLPQIDLDGIQVGGFSTPPIVLPPIKFTQTILPSFTLLPAISL